MKFGIKTYKNHLSPCHDGSLLALWMTEASTNDYLPVAVPEGKGAYEMSKLVG